MFYQFCIFLSHITRHSFHWICQGIVFEESCRSLSHFRKVLIGNTIVACLKSIYWGNKCTVLNWCLVNFFSYYPERDVTFILLLILVSMIDGNWNSIFLESEFFNMILKRSAGKKLSDKIHLIRSFA